MLRTRADGRPLLATENIDEATLIAFERERLTISHNNEQLMALHEKMLAYIPPKTKHNVTNTGTEILESV